jgi:hypothetical protein
MSSGSQDTLCLNHLRSFTQRCNLLSMRDNGSKDLLDQGRFSFKSSAHPGSPHWRAFPSVQHVSRLASNMAPTICSSAGHCKSTVILACVVGKAVVCRNYCGLVHVAETPSGVSANGFVASRVGAGQAGVILRCDYCAVTTSPPTLAQICFLVFLRACAFDPVLYQKIPKEASTPTPA